MRYSLKSWQNFFHWLVLWSDLDESYRHFLFLFEDVKYKEVEAPEEILNILIKASWFNKKDNEDLYRINPEAFKFIKILKFFDDIPFTDIEASITEQSQAFTSVREREFVLNVAPFTSNASITPVLVTEVYRGNYIKNLLEAPSAKDFLSGRDDRGLDDFPMITDRYIVNLRAAIHYFESSENYRLEILDAYRSSGITTQESMAEFTHISTGWHTCVFCLDSELMPLVYFIQPKVGNSQKFDEISFCEDKAVDSFSYPLILDDINTYVNYIETYPLETLSYNGVSAANHRKIIKHSVPVADEIEQFGVNDLLRGRVTIKIMEALKFVEKKGSAGYYKYHITREAKKFLEQSREYKLKEIKNVFSFDINNRKKSLSFDWLGNDNEMPMPWYTMEEYLFGWMMSQVKLLEKPVYATKFYEEISEKANPLVSQLEFNSQYAYYWKDWSASPEAVYPVLMQKYLSLMIVFGYLQYGKNKEHDIIFKLSDLGKWAMDLSSKFKFTIDKRKVANASSDHCIHILENNLEIRTHLWSFCKTTKDFINSLSFKIDKISIKRAVSFGWTGDEIIAELEGWLKTKIPENLKYEIQAWSVRRKRIDVNEYLLVECEDPLIIAEIDTTFPRQFEKLSPGVLRYVGKYKIPTIRKKLKDKGFM